MKVEFLGNFNKDLDKLSNARINENLTKVILQLENANHPNEIQNLKN